MASGGVVGETDPEPPVFEEEGRGDSADLKESKKSRKFKPFEAVRKLFKGGKKRTKLKDDNQISVVSVKAKSTTALTRAGGQDDDDDSDGGFKSHQSSKLQGGKRSISEDSVFTPGDRGNTDTSLTALKTVTVSEEHIPKDSFQTELFSKLKKRHSQYSDEDDGLPQSPVPPVTTADIIMGGSLKPHPAKSSSRESEKSLISVDSSDNEADDFVLSRWSSPGKPRSRSSDQSPPPEKGITMDFEAVKSTQALSNEAAKHKRSVKPQRKPQRQSRKRRDNNAPLALPGILESPTKVQTEETSKTDSTVDGVLTVTSKTGSIEKPSVSMSAVKPNISASKPDIVAKDTIVKETVAKAAEMPPKSSVEAAKVETKKDVKIEVKKDLPQVSTKPSHVSDSETRVRSVSLKEESTTEKSSELSKAMDKMKRRSIKEPIDLPNTKPETSEVKKVSEQKTEVVSSLVKTDSLSKTKPNATVEVKSSKPEETKPVLKKVEDPKPKSEEPKPFVNVEKPVDSKPSIVKQHSDDSNKSEKSDAGTEVKKDVGFRVTPERQPKEDYKLKRQSRSKTLPEQPQLPDDFTAKVQRTRSQRNESSPIASEASTEKTATTSTPTKMDPKRFTVHENPSSEPSWMAAIKKKKAEAENKSQDEKKDLMTTSAKEIFVKETEKPADKMSKSFTASSTSSSLFDSKPEPKKEVLTFSVNRNPSVKASTPPDSKTESAPKTFGSMKSPTKPVNIVSSYSAAKPSSTSAAATSTTKSLATTTASSAATSTPISTTTSTPTSTSTSKSFSSTSSSMSKSFTTTSSKPESIKSFGSSFKEKTKDTDKVSPTEEAKKVFARGQSVKATPTSESSSSPARTGSVKASSGIKPSIGKGSVQSKDSSVEKTQKDPSVPAWRSGVKSVNIEIIEKEPKQEVTMRKASVKKTTPTPAPDPDPCRDSSANRSSKVLDMVKNFQKLQVS